MYVTLIFNNNTIQFSRKYLVFFFMNHINLSDRSPIFEFEQTFSKENLASPKFCANLEKFLLRNTRSNSRKFICIFEITFRESFASFVVLFQHKTKFLINIVRLYILIVAIMAGTKFQFWRLRLEFGQIFGINHMHTR